MIGSTFSRFKILDQIGGGNTGVVFKAQDPKHQRRVALKILADDFLMNKEKKARFMREAKATRMLSHRAIARVYSAGEFEGHHFIAMEYVDGESYTHIIQNHPEGIRLEDFYRLILPILEGTAYAHERNIAHRDLKPDNLKLTRDGQPKILDFGLVKFLDHHPSGDESYQTIAGMVVGSAGYMSPEQAEGLDFDERTDVFSLGIIMYELLAGKNPFRGNSPFATISKILNSTPLSIELLRPDIPLPLCQVILKCLDKDMRRRYPNAKSILEAVIAVKRRAGDA